MPTFTNVPLPLDLALAELEQAFREQLVAEGRQPAGAVRDLFAHEIQAQVRFAEIEAEHTAAASAIAAAAQAVRAAALLALAAALADAEDPLTRLVALASPVHPDALDVGAEVEAAAAQIRSALSAAADGAAVATVAEAAAQGVDPALFTPRIPAGAGDVFGALASNIAAHPVSRVLAAASGTATRATASSTPEEIAAAAVSAAEGVSAAGTEDLARQAASRAQGVGRTAAAIGGPPPAQVYASELLDGSTCRPCSHVDGTEYATLADALLAYPDAAGYHDCDGGPRCRGTLVFVHGGEEPPTIGGPPSPPPPKAPPAPPVAPPPPAPPAALPQLDFTIPAANGLGGGAGLISPSRLRRVLGRDPVEGERFHLTGAALHGADGDGVAELHRGRVLFAHGAPVDVEEQLATLRVLSARIPDEYTEAVPSLASFRGSYPDPKKKGAPSKDTLATSSSDGIVVWNDAASRGFDAAAEETFDHEMGHSISRYLSAKARANPAADPLDGVFNGSAGGPRWAKAASSDAARLARGQKLYDKTRAQADQEWRDYNGIDLLPANWIEDRVEELIAALPAAGRQATMLVRMVEDDPIEMQWKIRPAGRARYGKKPIRSAVTDYAAAIDKHVEDVAESHRLYLRDRRRGHIGLTPAGEKVTFADLFPGRAALLDLVHPKPHP